MKAIASRFPAVRKPLTEIELCGWVGQAASGDILEYYRGFLALDIARQSTHLPERERAELARVARRAWWAAERGLIHLVQRRHPSGDYSYLAIARPKPNPTAVSLSSLLPAEVA